MDIFKSIILGALQGIAEFLPVSSSGHLLVTRNLLGLGEIPVLFDVLMHIPTLVVVLLVFRKKIKQLLISIFRIIRCIIKKEKLNKNDKEEGNLILIIFIATIFTAIIGFAFDRMENLFSEMPKIVGALFIITGVMLIFSQFFKGQKDYSKIKLKDGIITGIAQGIGALPGISRSGITITASLFCGLKRENAGEYSFLISIPAILGAFIIKIKDAPKLNIQMHILFIGLIVSFIIGFLSLLLLLQIIKKGRLYLFSIYLIPAGILTLLFIQ